MTSWFLLWLFESEWCTWLFSLNFTPRIFVQNQKHNPSYACENYPSLSRALSSTHPNMAYIRSASPSVQVILSQFWWPAAEIDGDALWLMFHVCIYCHLLLLYATVLGIQRGFKVMVSSGVDSLAFPPTHLTAVRMLSNRLNCSFKVGWLDAFRSLLKRFLIRLFLSICWM